MKIFLLIFYYSLGQKLPSSFYPGGFFFNMIRCFLISNIIKKCGKSNKIQKNVYVGNGRNIEIGSFCQINEDVKLDNVTIGNYVMIAPGVTILGKMHDYSSKEIPMILQGEKEVKSTIIENDIWIGTNAIIMPGILIKKGCIIGAGSVLTKDTESFGVYGGVPARLIKKRV